MFWIKTQFGDLINLADMKEICLEEERGNYLGNPFRVFAYTQDTKYLLAEFDNFQDAQNYLDKIFELLNGRVVYNG